jgi:hypothetical protein
MNQASQQTSAAPANAIARVILLGLVPVICMVIGFTYLPRPVPVEIARGKIDHKKIGDYVSKTRPKPKTALNANMGDSIKVIGIDLPKAPLRKGARIPVSFYFEALREMNQNWRIFVHIDAQSSRFRIHGDHEPVGGRYGTASWNKGDFVRDALDTTVPLDAPSGAYRVYIGFYIGDDRLPFVGGDENLHAGENRLLLGSLKVQ